MSRSRWLVFFVSNSHSLSNFASHAVGLQRLERDFGPASISDAMREVVVDRLPEASQPRPPSQQVSQIVWQRLHWSLARISISSPPQTGHAGRAAFVSRFSLSVGMVPSRLHRARRCFGATAFAPEYPGRRV